jgi:DNA-directed RNA polymerase specialized sigma24 family protein
MEDLSFSNESFLASYREYLRSLANAQLDTCQGAAVDPSVVIQETLRKARASRNQLPAGMQPQLAELLQSVLENALVDVLRSRASHEPNSSVAMNQMADRSAGQAGRAVAEEEEIPTVGGAFPDKRLLRLAGILAKLPDDLRTVLEMKHLYGLSMNVICERTGRSKLSVAGQLFAAMKTVRVLLQEHDQQAGQGNSATQ